MKLKLWGNRKQPSIPSPVSVIFPSTASLVSQVTATGGTCQVVPEVEQGKRHIIVNSLAADNGLGGTTSPGSARGHTGLSSLSYRPFLNNSL